MPEPDLVVQWRHRLVDLAVRAHDDDMTCLEHSFIVLAWVVSQPRRVQMVYATMMHDFNELLNLIQSRG